MIPSRSSQSTLALPLLYTTPFQPCTIRSARSFAAFQGEEGNGLWAEGDPRNLVKLARRNYRYWATTYRHGISSVPPTLSASWASLRRASVGFHTWMINLVCISKGISLILMANWFLGIFFLPEKFELRKISWQN